MFRQMTCIPALSGKNSRIIAKLNLLSKKKA